MKTSSKVMSVVAVAALSCACLAGCASDNASSSTKMASSTVSSVETPAALVGNSSQESVMVTHANGQTETLGITDLYELSHSDFQKFRSDYKDAQVTITSAVANIERGFGDSNGHGEDPVYTLDGNFRVEVEKAKDDTSIQEGDMVTVTGPIWYAFGESIDIYNLCGTRNVTIAKA